MAQRENLVDRRVIETRPPLCKSGVLPLSLTARGAWSLNRTNLFRSSGGRVDHDHYPGELERTSGIEPASARRQRAALPLSYVRMVGRGRIRTSEPRRDGVYSAAALAACIPARCRGPNRTDYLDLMSAANCRCSTLRQMVPGFASPERRAQAIRASRENWRKGR